MKIKFVSKGTGEDTSVVNAETGEAIEGVVSLEYKVNCGEIGFLHLTIAGVDADIECKTGTISLTQTHKIHLHEV